MALKNLPKDHGAVVALLAVGALAAAGSVASHPGVKRGTFNKGGGPSTRGKWVELSYSYGQATQQQSRGMYSDPTVILVKPKGMKNEVRLLPGSGSSDNTTVFQVDDYLYVLNTNTRHDYAGLRVYMIDPEGARYGEGEAVEAGEMFLQGDEQLKEVLGKRGLDLTERTIAKYMSRYIY